MCVFRFPDILNALSHSWHLYGLSPVWTLMCVFRVPDSLNPLRQMWQLYGLSPLWILLCPTSCPAIVNRLLQLLHSNGFSPEWLRLCSTRPLLSPQHLPHTSHLYLLVWIFTWRFKPLCDEKRFSHWLHEYNVSPVCLCTCLVKLTFTVNRFSHTGHTCGLAFLSSRRCSVVSLGLLLASDELSPV